MATPVARRYLRTATWVPHPPLSRAPRVRVVSWRFRSRVARLHPSTMASSHQVASSFDLSAFRRAMAPHQPLVFILLLAAALRLLYVDAPLLDAHRWRQVDTAFMARAFYEGGINPFRPEANWGGAHGYVESEFPLLPAIVAVLYTSSDRTKRGGVSSWRPSRLAPWCPRTCWRGMLLGSRQRGLPRRRWSRCRRPRCSTAVPSCPTR